MIDNDLLIHSVTAYTIKEKSADRKAIYDDGTELNNVRVSLQTAVNIGSDGKIKSDNVTLFIDCENSIPSGFVPAEGMKIVFNGNSYTIKSVKPTYFLDSTPSFYKCELV